MRFSKREGGGGDLYGSIAWREIFTLTENRIIIKYVTNPWGIITIYVKKHVKLFFY